MLRIKNINHERLGSEGFTLIEVAIAITIITIVLLVGIPNLKNASARYRIKSFCLDFSGLINRGKVRAIETRSNHTLVINPVNETVTIQPALPNGISSVQAPAGVDLFAIVNDHTTTDPAETTSIVNKTLNSRGSLLTGNNTTNFTIFIKSGDDFRYKIVVFALTGHASVDGSWQ